MINTKDPNYIHTPVSDARPVFAYYPEDANASPYVSIVTPFYNTGLVFHETAESIMRQSFQQWEWLIINDGSSNPDALEVLNKYRTLDPRIRVIDLPSNQGVSAAKNVGVKQSKTQLIVHLDSDDLLEPTAIEKWLWFLESYPEWSMVQGYSVGFGASQYLWTKGFHNTREILRENIIDYSSMVRKIVYQVTGGFDEEIRAGLEDWDFWCKAADRGYWGETIPEYLKWYRTRANHGEKWSNWVPDKLKQFREILKQRYPGLWANSFPTIIPAEADANTPIPESIPCINTLIKQKPRILFIFPWMITGGADKFNIDLIKHLTENNWEVSILTTMQSANEWQHEFARYTPDIFSLPNFLRLKDYPRFINYFIKSRNCDLVCISNSEFGYLLLPYLRNYFPTLPVIDYNHAEAMDWKSGGYPRYTLTYQDYIDLIIVASQHLKDWMIEQGGNQAKIEVAYVNVDANQFRPSPEARARVRSELSISQNVPVILYPARICIEKQPMVFAKAIHRLADKHPKFVALVAGDGPDFHWLKTYIAENHLEENVILFGAVPHRKVVELMQCADILFLPSLREGISLALYEAMACSLCVVGAAVGGQKELVDEQCGVLVPRSTVEEEAITYSDILASLVENPQRAVEMGKAGRKRILENFELEKMGSRMLCLLDQTLEKRDNDPQRFQTVDQGRVAAAMAVEYTRMSQSADELWTMYHQAVSQISHNSHLSSTSIETLRVRQVFYLGIRKLVLPYYNRMQFLHKPITKQLIKSLKKIFDVPVG